MCSSGVKCSKRYVQLSSLLVSRFTEYFCFTRLKICHYELSADNMSRADKFSESCADTQQP